MIRWAAACVLVLLVGAAVGLGVFLSKLRVEVSLDMLVGEEDESAAIYTSSRQDWGTDEYAIVCLTRDDWFTPEAVADIDTLIKDLASSPFVTSTTSVLDLPLLRQKRVPNPNLFAFQRDIRRLTDPDVDLARAREEICAHEYALGNVVSADGRILNVLVHIDTMDLPEGRAASEDELNRRRQVVVDELRDFAKRWSERLGHPVYLTNVPVINVNIIEHIRHDLRVFGIAALLLFLLGFAVIYRNWRYVVIPVTACLLPVAIIVGGMAWKGWSLTVITSNMPLLLFVLLLPYTVYLMERYRERRRLFADEANEVSVLGAARDLAMPCLFSSLTTMAGFVALTLGDIKPVRQFGGMMAGGIALGLVLVFVYLIAWYVFLPGPQARRRAKSVGSHWLMDRFAHVVKHRPGVAIITSLVFAVLAAVGAMRLSSENKFTNYFWPGDEVYDGLEYVDQEVGGTVPLEVVLKADEPGYFLKDEGFAAIRAVESFFAVRPETGNVRSLDTLRRELRKTFSEERFPGLNDAALLGVLRLQAPELLTDHVDPQAVVSRIYVRMRETAPTLDRNRILRDLDKHLAARPELGGLTTQVTGVFQVYAQVLNSLVVSQKSTFRYVVLALFCMLSINFFILLVGGNGWQVIWRAPLLALLVLLPQVLPALLMLGVMGWGNIPLDMVTVMIAAIAMGVGIDAGIQYTVRYYRELHATGDPHAAVDRAHATIGRAIWIATSVIVAGFCVLMFSGFRPSVWFGLLTALAMLFSQFAALTLLPSILVLTRQPRVK